RSAAYPRQHPWLRLLQCRFIVGQNRCRGAPIEPYCAKAVKGRCRRMTSTMPTDKIDARILRVLQEEGRISNLQLAERVHLSPTAVAGRVKRLKREGYILGYR